MKQKTESTTERRQQKERIEKKEWESRKGKANTDTRTETKKK